MQSQSGDLLLQGFPLRAITHHHKLDLGHLVTYLGRGRDQNVVAFFFAQPTDAADDALTRLPTQFGPFGVHLLRISARLKMFQSEWRC